MTDFAESEKSGNNQKLSHRTNWKSTLNPLSLRLKSLQQGGARILDLSESNPTRCQFHYLTSGLIAPLTHPASLRYEPHPKGMLEARKAISNDYREKGILIDPEHIFLTASTSEAYSFLFRLLTNPGERILVPRPTYPLFEFLADLNDVSLDSYALHYDAGSWHIDLENISASCRPDTKAIILVHPHNPTGSFIKKKEFSKIVEIAKESSLAIISDEVFLDYFISSDPERCESLAANEKALTFTLGGISKSLGLPQMKLAWLTANGRKEMLCPILDRLEIICDTYLSANTPAQAALPFWFQSKKTIQDEIKARTMENRVFLLQQLKRSNSISCFPAEGGWYAILRLPEIQTEEEWALEFLEKDRVYLYPGYFFDFESGTQMILSLLPHPTIFQEALLRILARVGNKC